jgi:hypothetical protein
VRILRLDNEYININNWLEIRCVCHSPGPSGALGLQRIPLAVQGEGTAVQEVEREEGGREEGGREEGGRERKREGMEGRGREVQREGEKSEGGNRRVREGIEE